MAGYPQWQLNTAYAFTVATAATTLLSRVAIFPTPGSRRFPTPAGELRESTWAVFLGGTPIPLCLIKRADGNPRAGFSRG
jgi:hypothetical protein